MPRFCWPAFRVTGSLQTNCFLAAMALCSLDFRAAWDCVLALSAETATLETTPAFRSPHYEGEDGSGLPRQRSLWDHVTVCSFGAFL